MPLEMQVQHFMFIYFLSLYLFAVPKFDFLYKTVSLQYRGVISFHVETNSSCQDQDSLLVKRRNDNHSPGPVIRELVPSSHQRSELSNTILCIFSG